MLSRSDKLVYICMRANKYSCLYRCKINSTALYTRCSSTAAGAGDDVKSENDVLSEKFVNRNPRNLEFMGIARRRKGWRFQYPTRQYYHRLLFEKTNRNTTGRVEHADGSTVLSASTKEFAIAKHLYSFTDVSAAENIGRVLAQRCRESGITSMILEPPEQGDMSDKLQAFRTAIEQGGVDLEEIAEVEAEYVPGIDYDDPEVVADLSRRQNMVDDVSELTRLALKMRKPDRGQRAPDETIYENRFRKRPTDTDQTDTDTV